MENESLFTLGNKAIQIDILKSTSTLSQPYSTRSIPADERGYSQKKFNSRKNIPNKSSFKQIKENESNTQNIRSSSSGSKNLLTTNANQRKSVKSVKASLVEVLTNINKELNVKIHNNEQSKAEFSLMNFVDKADETLETDENQQRSKSTKKEDGFSKRKSKKVDIQEILGNFNHEKVSNFDKIEKIEEVKENLEDKFENISIQKSPNLNKLYIPEFKNKQDEEIFNSLKNSKILNINESQTSLNSSIFPTNNGIKNSYGLDLIKLIEFIKAKDDEIIKKNSIIETNNKEIHFLKSELDLKKSSTKDLKKEDDEKDFMYRLKEIEGSLKISQNHSLKIEKENVILKNNLGNVLKTKNNLIKRFNEELEDINRLSNSFFNNFIMSYENQKDNIKIIEEASSNEDGIFFNM
jgi:hypothetical protein